MRRVAFEVLGEEDVALLERVGALGFPNGYKSPH